MKTFPPFLVLLMFTISFAQPQAKPEKKEIKYGWSKEMVGNLNFTQNSFDNWSQGGENSWAWQLNISGKWVKKESAYNWSNMLKIAYGKTKIGDKGTRKSIDEIRLESVFTRNIGLYVNPFVAVTGLSQFTKGYKYTADTSFVVSAFMDPGYFTQTLGLGYAPGETIKTRLGASIKETITRSYEDVYGEGDEFRIQYGMSSVTDISLKLTHNLIYTGKLELFSTLSRFNEIDVNWDNLFVSQISKYINVNFNFKLFYDRDVSKARQIQQVLAVGLTYTFF